MSKNRLLFAGVLLAAGVCVAGAWPTLAAAAPAAAATSTPYKVCPDLPPTTRSINSWVMANPELKVVVNIRAKAGNSATSLGLLKASQWAKIVGGPECVDNTIWWKVEAASSKITGWLPERDATQIWLVDIPTAVTNTPRPTYTWTPSPNYTGTRQAVNQASTASKAAAYAQATQAAQKAIARQTSAKATQAAAATATRAALANRQANASATQLVIAQNKTATALVAPTRTAAARATATAAQATLLAQRTVQAAASQTARKAAPTLTAVARLTQTVKQTAAAGTATAQAASRQATQAAQYATNQVATQTMTALDAQYPFTAYYAGIGARAKLRFRAYVASISGNNLVVYTSGPDRQVLVQLRSGTSTTGLRITSPEAFYLNATATAAAQAGDKTPTPGKTPTATVVPAVAFTFYGEGGGTSSAGLPILKNAFWMP